MQMRGRGGMMMNRGMAQNPMMMRGRGRGMQMPMQRPMMNQQQQQALMQEKKFEQMKNQLTQLKGKARVQAELKWLQECPMVNVASSVGLPDPKNPMVWRLTLNGPTDSPYANGLFYLRATFPPEYPAKKPEVDFLTPIYHINVKHTKGGDEPLGHVCISTINWWEANWLKNKYNMRNVISDIFALFYMGNPDSPYGFDRQSEMRTNKPLYDKKVKYFTEKYAKAKNKAPPMEGLPAWDFTWKN